MPASSPYIVTTKRYPGPIRGMFAAEVSRRAVATLEKAQQRIVFILALGDHMSEDVRVAGWLGAEKRISESGGTVGPLPDGTVIEVERSEWRRLGTGTIADAASEGQPHAQKLLLDVFNRDAGTCS